MKSKDCYNPKKYRKYAVTLKNGGTWFITTYSAKTAEKLFLSATGTTQSAIKSIQ